MKKVISALLVAILVMTVGIGYKSALFANGKKKSEWNMFRCNTEHTGSIKPKYAPKTNKLRKLWSFKAGDTILSSPSIVNDSVYFGSHDHRMYCLSATTGEKTWEYRAKDIIKSSPVVYKGQVYFGSLDGTFHCIDDAGEKVWYFDTKRNGGIASSPLVSGGAVIFGTLDGYLMSIKDDGDEELWKLRHDDAFSSSPALSNGSILIGTRDFELLCVDEFSGEKVWQTKLAGSIYATPSIMDNFAYVGCDGKKLYCIDIEKGTIEWEFDTTNVIRSTPALSAGYVVFSSGFDVFCLSQEDGSLKWRYNVGNQGVSSITIAGDRIYASMGATLSCLDIDTGAEIWQERLESDSYSPSIAYNKIYVGTKDGYLHCFEDDTLAHGVVISPSIVDLGEYPPLSAVSGTIKLTMPFDGDIENIQSIQVEFETDVDWFSIISSQNVIKSNAALEVIISVDDGVLSEDKTWYSGRIICKFGDDEYPIIVKVYTDSDLELDVGGEIIVSKRGCSWNSITGDPAGTSCATEFCGPEGDTLSRVWDEEFDDSLNNIPLVAQGFVYITPSYSNEVFCFDVDTGVLVWNVELEGYINDSCALYGGMMFIPTNIGIMAISQKDGSVNWIAECDEELSTPVTVYNGKVLFGTGSGEIFCLNNQNGGEFWSYQAEGRITTYLAVSTDSVFFGSSDQHLYSVSLETGERIWSFDTTSNLYGGPVFVNEKVLIATEKKRLFCFKASNGEQLWLKNTIGGVKVSPSASEERIYVYSDDSVIRCYEIETGDEVWDLEVIEDIEGHPTLSGGRLYFGTWDANVYCVDTITGISLWNYETDSRIRAPIVVSSGKVLVCSGRKLICFGDPPPDVIIDPQLVDFGGIEKDKDVDTYREITLENTTDTTLIVDLTPEEDVEWFIPLIESLTLDPGEKIAVPVAAIKDKIPGGMPSSYLYISWNEAVVPVVVRAYIKKDPSLMSPDWLAFGRDQLRQSYMPASAGPETKELQELWAFDSGLETDSSPVINKEKLFLGFADKFFCLDPVTGEHLWEKQFDRDGFSSAGCCTGIMGQMVLVGSADGNMYCLESDTGNKMWKYQSGGPIFSSPAIHEKRFNRNEPRQRRVYFGSLDNKVYSLLANNGDLIWEFETGGSVYSSPCIPPFGDKVFIGSLDDSLYAIDTVTGKEIWSYKTGGSIYSTPCCHMFGETEGYVFVGSNDGTMYCFNANNGKLRWKYETDSPIICSPALYDGKVFFGNVKGEFYGLNRETGDKVKMIRLGSQIRTSPSLNARQCYLTTKNGRFFSIDSDTFEILWNTRIGAGSGHLQSSPAIWGKNVYIGDRDGILHCFSEKQPELEFETETIDFGQCAPKSLKSQKLWIKSNATRDIEVTFEDSYDWFDLADEKLIIPAGERVSLKLVTVPKKLTKTGMRYAGIWARWTSDKEEEMSQRIAVVIVIKE